MKKILFFLITAFSVSMSYGQCETANKELSNAEKFEYNPGSLIQKEFINIGTVRKVDFKAIHYLDLNTLDSLRALRFEYFVASANRTVTKIATVDPDEIEGLIAAVKIIQEKLGSANLINRTEVTYRSRGEFEVGCYLRNTEWTAYLKLFSCDYNSRVILKKDDLSQLLSLLEKAKELLG